MLCHTNFWPLLPRFHVAPPEKTLGGGAKMTPHLTTSYNQWHS